MPDFIRILLELMEKLGRGIIWLILLNILAAFLAIAVSASLHFNSLGYLLTGVVFGAIAGLIALQLTE